MERSSLATLATVVAAAALVLAPTAEAKFSISLTVEPSRPIAGDPVRLTMRTGIVLPKQHGMRLNAVGPWREELGQSFLDVRLIRIGPRAFKAKVRFPHAGRWRLIVPNWGAPGSAHPPPVDRPVMVRPRR
jgi:hypothetical protein